MLELETDKATVEVPSSLAGVVKESASRPGDKVKPGQAVLIVDDAAWRGAPPQAEPPKAEAPAAAARTTAGRSRLPRRPAAAPSRAGRGRTAQGAGRGHRRRRVRPAASQLAAAARRSCSAPAAPSVRRLAREIGVDITQVPGTGPVGGISIEDVKEFAKRVMSSFGSAGQAAAASGGAAPLRRGRCPTSASGARWSARR